MRYFYDGLIKEIQIYAYEENYFIVFYGFVFGRICG